MENKLAENIRIYRKALGLTQDQLAERLGITLGTVSKWERGTSEPDLGYLMDLAEVFHASVDALIGFRMHGNDAEAEAERIKENAKQAAIEETAREYENALKKFPNHFRIVCGAANTYQQIGVVYRKDPATRRALELYRHALELISQNTDPDINELVLRNEIAGCYAALKEYKKAIEEYKRNNLVGNNDAVIGLTMIMDMKKPEEGIEHTERSFFSGIREMITTMSGYAHYGVETGKTDQCIRASRWTISWLKSLKEDPERASYTDKISCLFMLLTAIARDMAGETEQAQTELAEAVRAAGAFDAEPVYTLENLVFAGHMKETQVYDDAGPTALESVKQMMEESGKKTSEAFRKKFLEAVK